MENTLVLIIDDDEYVRHVLIRMVESLGFDAVAAAGGQQAMELIHQREYGIVLCDVNMPHISGLEVLGRIKKIYPFTVIIMISGIASLDAALEATKLGAYDYLTKPFNLDQVRLSIHRGLENRKLQATNLMLMDNLQKLNKNLENKVRERNAELRLAYDELKELEILKSNFLDLVSHELNSPLTVVSGYLELLEDNLNHFSVEELASMLEPVAKGTRRLRKLVNDIMDLTRMDMGRLFMPFQVVSLKQILEQIIESAEHIAKQRNLHLTTELPREDLKVMGDSVRLSQAFQNLINNAIKFTPDGKAITITLKKSKNNWARLVISDQGVGIPKKNLKTLFKPFSDEHDISHHSTSETNFMGGGLGLGLPISQRIIMAHGGKITAKSDGKGKGSVFIVNLPLANAENGD